MLAEKSETNSGNSEEVESFLDEAIEAEPAQKIETDPNKLETARVLKIKIKKYLREFPEELHDISAGDLDMMSTHDLQNKYNEILVALNSGNNSIISSAYYTAVGVTEQLGTMSGFVDLTGLTKRCQSNPQIRKCLTQLEIEYSDYTLIQRPEERLLFTTLLMLLVTNQQNKAASAERSIENAKISNTSNSSNTDTK